MYFLIIEVLKKFAIDFFIFYGTVICFHTKYNKEYFMNTLADRSKWGTGLIEEFRMCPTLIDKLDYIGGNIINLLLPASVWFFNIIIWSNKYG